MKLNEVKWNLFQKWIHSVLWLLFNDRCVDGTKRLNIQSSCVSVCFCFTWIEKANKWMPDTVLCSMNSTRTQRNLLSHRLTIIWLDFCHFIKSLAYCKRTTIATTSYTMHETTVERRVCVFPRLVLMKFECEFGESQAKGIIAHLLGCDLFWWRQVFSSFFPSFIKLFPPQNMGFVCVHMDICI